MLATRREMIGFLPAGGAGGEGRTGDKRSCANTFVLWRYASEFRNDSDGTRCRHTYSTLLRSVGTEFKVMQELLRHSTLRSTLDVYTQAVTPAKHAAQAAIMSLLFSSNGSSGSPLVGQDAVPT
jgi:integrase